MAETKRCTGIVKWFSAQKGFGFIAPEAGSDDLFVHQTCIRSDGFRTLSEGQSVEFSFESGEDGRTKAIDVAVISGPRRSGGRGGRRGGGGRDRGGGYGRGRRGGACYNCGRTGHIARDCYSGGGGRRYGGGGRGGCYNCGEKGHFARDCPNNEQKK